MAERNQNGSKNGTKGELPPHPWPPVAEELYQKSLEAAMMSAIFMSSPDQFTREMGLAEYAKSRILGDMAVDMVKPPKLVMIW